MTQPTIGSNVRTLGHFGIEIPAILVLSWFQASGWRGETWEYYLPSLGPCRSGKTLWVVLGKLLKLGEFAGEFACPLVYLLRGHHCSLFQCRVSSHFYAWCPRWFSSQQDTDAIIFVVDSNDQVGPQKFEEYQLSLDLTWELWRQSTSYAASSLEWWVVRHVAVMTCESLPCWQYVLVTSVYAQLLYASARTIWSWQRWSCSTLFCMRIWCRNAFEICLPTA